MPRYDAGELASSGVVVTVSVPLIVGHPGMRRGCPAPRHPPGELCRLWRPDPAR
jgi:hypothetical protein